MTDNEVKSAEQDEVFLEQAKGAADALSEKHMAKLALYLLDRLGHSDRNICDDLREQAGEYDD